MTRTAIMFDAEDLDSEPGLERAPREKKPMYRRERHLASAITTTEIDYILTHKYNSPALRNHHKILLEIIEGKTLLDSKGFLSWCCRNLEAWCSTDKEDEELQRRAAHIAIRALDVSYSHFYRSRTPIFTPDTFPLSSLFSRLASNWDKTIRQASMSDRSHMTIITGSVTVDYVEDICIVHASTTTCYVVPYSLILCFSDMCASWFSVDCYAALHSTKYPGFNLLNEYRRVWGLMRDLIISLGQRTYMLLKAWPSLVIGSILRDLENSNTFITTLTVDLPYDLKQSALFLEMTNTITSPQHAMLKLEMAGLWKVMGHPIVNMSLSTAAWRRKGTVMKPNLIQASVKISNMFKKEFCRQFYKTHKRWPNVRMSSSVNPHILASWHTNNWGEAKTHQWNPEDFGEVELLKNFEFNYFVDTIDIISDKAIIPKMSEWIYEYDKKAYRTLYGSFPTAPPPTTKSVVMHFLQTEIFDCKEIIELINKGVVPYEWRVMVAVPKEREFKEEDARCYGKMTPEMRAYQVVTEKNIADTIFKYIKHQSMTLTEEQLIKTLNRMSSPGDDHNYVNIIIDFSSWCTHFRAELLDALFKNIDDLFGLENVYSFTHAFPLISILLFQDRYCPPRQGSDGMPEDGPRCVHSPEAWLEGLRQKGWTLATLLLILYSAHKCQTTASLLGQGDNQVILLRIPSSSFLADHGTTREEYTAQFMSHLEEICTEAGVVIKVPESWVSKRLLEYGRRYYLDGVHVSSALKKASRLTSEANLTVPTLNTIVAGLYSSGASIAADDITPIPAYAMTTFYAALTLFRAVPDYQTQSNEWMVVLLLMSRAVGGYPTVLFPQFALRATQDTLSLALSTMKHLLKIPAYRTCVYDLLDISKPDRIDTLQLIKDPSSIPLRLPTQPENFFRRMLKEGLPNIIANRTMASVFNSRAEAEEEKLKADLLSIRPINPKLLCKLWQLSNIGVREKVIGKFATSRSIQSASMGTWIDENQLWSTIRALETRTVRYYLQRKNSHFTARLEHSSCVTTITQLVREELWGLPLEGITMPTPCDQLVLMPWTQLPTELAPSAIMVGWLGRPDTNCFYERGPRTPYIGSQTHVRARRAALQVLEVGSIIENIKALLELKSWVKGSKGLQDLLVKLIEEKTMIPLSELEPYTSQVYSGMLSHRLPCPALRRGGMWNGCTNLLTWIRIVSDTATNYAKKGQNYNLCFQEIFLYGQAIISEWYREYGYVHATTALIIANKCCVWELPPEEFTLDSTTYSGVPLIKVLESVTQVEDRHLVPHNIEINPRLSYSIHAAHKLAAWILHIRSEEFVTSLENRAVSESVHASFLNLTEFKGVQVSTLLPTLTFYLWMYDTTFKSRRTSYFDAIFSRKKTAYDVFLDTIMACGKAGELYSIAGISASRKESDLRDVLYMALTRYVDEGFTSLISKGAYLTPDNAEKVLPRYVKAVLQVLGEPAPPRNLVTFEDYVNYVKSLAPAINQHIPIRVMHTEEESVSYVRSVEGPMRGENRAVGTLTESTGSYEALQNIHVSPKAISMTMVYSLPQIGVSLLLVLQNLRLPSNIEQMVTMRDEEGLLFNAAKHVLPLNGYPHWKNISPDSNIWERGPLACATDPCELGLNLEGFYTSILLSEDSLIHRIKEDQKRTLIIYGEEPSVSDLSLHLGDRSSVIMFPTHTLWGHELFQGTPLHTVNVVPPLPLDQGPNGSLWTVVGDAQSAFSCSTLGFSPHLRSWNTVMSWAEPHIRWSIMNRTSCFNMFRDLILLLSGLPGSLHSLYGQVQDLIIDSAGRLKQEVAEKQDYGCNPLAEDENMQQRTTESRVGTRIYALWITLKLIIRSDFHIQRVANIRPAHLHLHMHHSRICYRSVCGRESDAVPIKGRTAAVTWANEHLPLLQMYSAFIERVGATVFYRGPHVRTVDADDPPM